MYNSVRQPVTLSSNDYAPTLFVRAGHYVWVYDPQAGLVQSPMTTAITWRGEDIYPAFLRCRAVTWPIKKGMGVYARTSAATATYVDLSDWMEWDTDETQWELGSSDFDADQNPEQLGSAFLGVNADIVARISTPAGVIASHTLTTAFTSSATHTTTQAEGLTVTVNDVAGRKIKISMNLGLYASGGAQGIVVDLQRDGTVIRRFGLPDAAVNAANAHAATFVYYETIVTTKAAAVYRLMINALTNNTAVNSFGSALQPRQLIIEDCGA
jgi:hypothetical protein